MEDFDLKVNHIKIYSFEVITVKKDEIDLPYDVILLSSALDKTDLGDPVLHFVIENSPVPVKIAKAHHKIYYYVLPDAPLLLGWVRRNFELLMNHWNGMITDREMINLIYKGDNYER